MSNIQPINYLRMYRRRIGFSQEELAQLLGYKTHVRVARYERDLRVPGRDNLMLLEEIYGENLAGLFPGDAKRLLPKLQQCACKLRDKIQSKKTQSEFTRQKVARLSRLCGSHQESDRSGFAYDLDAECGSKQVVARLVKFGQPVWAGESRLLAIDPTSRGFGFVILEQDPSFLLDWGVAHCRDYLKVDCLKRIEKLISYFQPTDLLVEDSCPIPRSRCHKLRQFIRKFKAVAKKQGLTVHVLPSATVRATFAAEGARNQEQRAAAITRLFPELRYRLPPHRDTWMTEDYWMTVFDCLTLITAFLKIKRSKLQIKSKVT